jgi:ABC-type methionine transport system permease subunit
VGHAVADGGAAADKNQIQAAFFGWRSVNGDIDSAIQDFGSQFWRPAGNNLSFYKSDEFDRLLTLEQSTLDAKKRLSALHRMQELLMDEAPALFLYGEPQIWAARGGWFDRLTMRLVDILLSFPTILLAIIVITIFGPGLRNAMIAIGIAQVPLYARLMRGAALKVKSLDYVLAARASGARESRILWRHVVPNCMPPLLVQSTLFFATAILSAAYLGFLGLGAQPPTAEWGTMLSKARDFLRVAAHVSIFPGLTIMVTVVGLNFLGDGLRDVLDPRTSVA